MRSKLILLLGFLVCIPALTQTLEPKPDDARLAPFKPAQAPQPHGLLLKQGDRLAICGDSITEQKMYSRIMEDYLTIKGSVNEIVMFPSPGSGRRMPYENMTISLTDKH
jgi:hypothetical protein